ncbi:NAD(P)/FAD-dependent oxidoreductase [Plastorhodobacter daqingensis]|uniref:NAD(P)/FAD-dependent oxidoreductase n=1 Tax=Plastorhodobacter daqingensis TaxID=1387281 RepID=A0ABW2UKW7_9RHOB
MTGDFIIIGGGIAGLSAAARLSELGSVTLLEAEEALGYHASGRSAALYEAAYGLPPTVALNVASYDHHRAAGVLSPRGLMVLARADQRDAYRQDVAAMSLNEMTFEEAHALVPVLNPETVAFAAHHDAAWDIDTDLLLQGFAREARARGARILTRAPAIGITRTRNGWEVETPEGMHEGRVLINAAGAWVDRIATMAGVAPLGFTPLRRSMARIPAPGGHDLRHWPMIFGAGEGWYAKPDAGKLLVSPAEEDPAEPHDAWPDDMVLAEGLARYEEMVTEPVTRLDSSWAGLRTFAPDRTLVIGFDAAQPAFFWLAGQGGYGMQTSPAASRLAADLIAGRTSELGADMVAALSPARFR